MGSSPRLALGTLSVLAFAGCTGDRHSQRDAGPAPTLDGGGTTDAGATGDAAASGDASICTAPRLRLNEAVSDNDGVWLDELGEADDWIEIYNAGDGPVELSEFSIGDERDELVALPPEQLAPGKTKLFWADGELDQGRDHLPFKLSAGGEKVFLHHKGCGAVDKLELPALALNESWTRLPDATGEPVVCMFPTPDRLNGSACEPPEAPPLPNDVKFASYTWPEGFGEESGPLVISELALRPAGFIELLNLSDAPVTLEGQVSLRLATMLPGATLPDAASGVNLSLPSATLAAGARLLVPVTAEDTAALVASPEFEGVASLFDAAGTALDRVDFMQWPQGASLQRFPENSASLTFCATSTPGAENVACPLLPARAAGDRLRYLRTTRDFAALAAGGTELGQEAVKVVVDMQADDTVYLLGSERWPLHYTFVRERIYGEPPLDRCDPVQAREFNQGWYDFSAKEYLKSEGRRFLLATLVEHASGMHTLEFSAGDAISPAQMLRAFFAVVRHTTSPQAWALRPADDAQIARMRMIEGKAPIVAPNAPYGDLRFQPLTQAVGYGVLTFIASADLPAANLGPKVILVTDAVPNELPLVGGLITEAFQTPLAHVNVLSRARGTPNMALREARVDPRLAPWLGKLVKLAVSPGAFTIQAASAEEADGFWRTRGEGKDPVVPPLNPEVRGIVELNTAGIESLASIGAKAAQFAELYQITKTDSACPAGVVPLNVPRSAFAVPVAHYLDHFQGSGAKELLDSLLNDAEFRADPVAHEAGLAAVRAKMLAHPVDSVLLLAVERAITTRFADAKVRMRSSSNTEDLPTFNGAGLHTSESAQPSSPTLTVELALQTVWSSLWNTRAFDEREFAAIDQSKAAMGVLVHQAQDGEAAQGVAISRNLLDVTRSSIYYIDSQLGEASVTNPAPGVTSEQLLYTWPERTPELTYLSQSSLARGERVLSARDARHVACALRAVHNHFRPLLDPLRQNRYFAMQVEWKLERGTRAVVIKQARPQPFDPGGLPTDCRDIN